MTTRRAVHALGRHGDARTVHGGGRYYGEWGGCRCEKRRGGVGGGGSGFGGRWLLVCGPCLMSSLINIKKMASF